MSLCGRPPQQKGQGGAAATGRKTTPARKNAKDQDCTLMLDGCQGDTETVVLCHVRRNGWGGMSIKPKDFLAFFGCVYCHFNEAQATDADLLRAVGNTLIRQFNDGVFIIK